VRTFVNATMYPQHNNKKIKVNVFSKKQNIKNSCSVKGSIKRKKRQTTDWETVYANHIHSKGLVSRICINNSNNPIGKTHKQTFH
jgi:hypothetical protein